MSVSRHFLFSEHFRRNHYTNVPLCNSGGRIAMLFMGENLRMRFVFCLAVFIALPVAGMAENLPAGCEDAVTHRACVNPLRLSAENPDCKQWENFVSCTRCKPCYEKFVNGNYPDNEFGNWSGETYGCREVGYTRVATTGTNSRYEYRNCGGDYEFQCVFWDSSLGNIYQYSTPTCMKSVNSDGTVNLYRCTGCSICDETEQVAQWKNVSGNTAYQQQYLYKYENRKCPLVAQQKYRCNIGFYGNPGTTMSGCNACPTLAQSGLTVVDDPEGITGVTSAAGATKITDCYARTGNNDTRAHLSDGTGTFYWCVDPDGCDGYCNYE